MGNRSKAPNDASVQAFLSSLRGNAVRPGDVNYETARKVYNGMIDRKPWMVVRCADVADVIHSVNFAREEGLSLAIRGGGHSVPGFGTCDDGLVVDLGTMKGVRVDPKRRTARFQTGCTWGDADHATHAFGLATPGGVISTTGLSGLTLGGGFGYLTRRYGLSCDNVVSADVVTADGKFLTASASENSDLFWALRGGGGNFGVVTSMEFKMHPVSMVYAGPVFYPVEKADGVLRLYRQVMSQAPRELCVFFAFLIVPPGPPFPEALHGKTVCAVMCCYNGDLEKGPEAVKPFLGFGPPVFSHLGPVPYPAVQSMFDPLLPPGLHHYWKADFVKEISDKFIAEYVKYGAQVPTVNSAIHLYPLGGAVSDVGRSDTAFAWRDAGFVHIIAAVSPDASAMPKYRDWVRDYWTALHPHCAGGTYVNFLMDEGEERISASYQDNYQRLAQIKKKYDPTNLFHVNQNIKPAP
jgi:FAD/FMN-containing dehydrogenase